MHLPKEEEGRTHALLVWTPKGYRRPRMPSLALELSRAEHLKGKAAEPFLVLCECPSLT